MKFFVFFIFSSVYLLGADIVVCSYNRPMQLYALLESIEKRVSGYDTISVICRSDLPFREGYSIVKEDFPRIKFFFQPENQRRAFASFKNMVVDQMYGKNKGQSDYFLFAMDDIVVTDQIDLVEGENFLEENRGVHGFFYRLGKNVVRHTLPKPGITKLPLLSKVEEDIFCWEFSKASFDWAYPNSLDFILYRKKEFRRNCIEMSYYNPNALEAKWMKYLPKNGKGACHSRSKIINLCINRVNTTHLNKTIKDIPVEYLNDLFMEGKKIDIFSIDKNLVNNVHQAIPFEYINRD